MASLIAIDIEYNIVDPSRTLVRTNAKPERVREILEDWIHVHVGQGEDHSEPNLKEVYHITISLDLSSDTFRTVSDTGNKGATAGIVMSVAYNFDWTKIQPLERSSR